MQASGISIHTPDIPGVGKVRLRYPIVPLHQEGSALWKEFDALKDITLNRAKYFKLYPSVKPGDNGTLEEVRNENKRFNILPNIPVFCHSSS